MILSAQSIRRYCSELIYHPDTGWLMQDGTKTPIITPFHGRTHKDGMTFGLSAAGYDVRIKQAMTLQPGECRLASTIERFDMPRDLLAMVADKSTWARRFLTVQHTVIEPGWNGHLTLELVNHSSLIIDIPAGAPIAQIIFHRLDEPTAQPYAGKYQNQADCPVEAILPGIDTEAPLSPETRWSHITTPGGYVNTSERGYFEETVSSDQTQIASYRIIPGDDVRDIYIRNKRIGYVENDTLFLIGKEGHAEPICDVDDLDCLPTLLRQHYKAI